MEVLALAGREMLAGPRGRRMCFEVVRQCEERRAGPDERSLWWWVVFHDDRVPVGDLADELAAAVALVDLQTLSRTASASDLLPALGESVNWARYWQAPDDIDLVLSDPALAALLRPVAEALLAAPAARWWTEPSARDGQWRVRWRPDGAAAPASRHAGAAEVLRAWRSSAVTEEDRARRERPTDPSASHSGHWWSTPGHADLVSSTPVVPDTRLPVGLVLLEDSPGDQQAEVRRVLVDPAARVYEITGATAWVALCARYPLPVTSSRRHDWFRTTGWPGPWVMPDWQAVGADWDGVHLQLLGYLTAAGRLLATDPASTTAPCTLLAGWDPGATWWLADVTTLGPPVTWDAQPDRPFDWHPAA